MNVDELFSGSYWVNVIVPPAPLRIVAVPFVLKLEAKVTLPVLSRTKPLFDREAGHRDGATIEDRTLGVVDELWGERRA